MITPHQFAALLLRVFALWLLFTAAQIGLLTYALMGNDQHNPGVSYALAAVYLIGALLLWQFPLALAARILPRSSAAQASGMEARGAAAVAFISAGLLIIALKALTPVANYVTLVCMLLLTGQVERLGVPSLHMDGVVGIVMLVAGLVFILKSRAMAGRLLPGKG